MTNVSVYDQLHKPQLWHVFPNGADSDLVRHALCNVIGWVRQRLLSATKGVEQLERVPGERRRLRWEWKLNSF